MGRNVKTEFSDSETYALSAPVGLEQNRSSRFLHAGANSNPGHSRQDEVDAQKDTEYVEARDWPTRQNDKSEKQRDQRGEEYPEPRSSILHAECQNDPHDAR